MAIQKLYRLTIGFRESYNFIVEGKEVEVLFTGGMRTPGRISGYYMTSDAKLQDLLEKSIHFNTRYILEWSKQDDTIPEVPKVVKEKSVVVKEVELPKTTEGDIVVPEVVNWKQAQSYIIKSFPDKYNTTLNKEGVLKAMEEHGILFPNWNS